jgi:HSP20 family protein
MKGNNMNTTVRESRGTEARKAEQFVAPRAGVVENGQGYILQVEMPGVNKDGLEIAMEDNELTIIGRRSLPTVDGTLVHQESRRKDFRRAFEIDPSIDTDKISAQIDQGILTLKLPKSERVKPRKIAVS